MIGIGVIGCGGIAQHAHIPSIVRAPGLALRAVVDMNREVAEKVGAARGLAADAIYDDHRPMLERSDIDAVSICVWTGLHARLAIEAMEAGKHVLVEKPMAVTTEEAQAMQAAAEKTGKVLMIGCNHSYDPATDHVKQMLEAGELGELIYGEVFFYEDLYGWTVGALNRTIRPTPVEPAAPAKPRPPQPPRMELINYLHNFNSHNINLMRYLIGEPGGVDHATYIANQGYWAQLDYGSFKVGFKNVLTKQHLFEKGIELCGTKKRVRIECAPPLQRYSPGRVLITDAENRCLSEPQFHFVWPFEAEYLHFCECIEKGVEPRTSGRFCVPDVTLVEQMTDAAGL